jgi:hypothetical protein
MEERANITSSGAEPMPVSRSSNAGAGLVIVLAVIMILSVMSPWLFIFGAGAAVILSAIAAGKVYKAIQKASEDSSKKYALAARVALDIFAVLVGLGIALVTLLTGIIAFFMAFFTANPVRS